MNDQMRDLKDKYERIPIPVELHCLVERTVKETRAREQRMKISGWIKKGTCCAAAAAVCFGVLVNVSPGANEALAQMPLVGPLVKVVTLKEFRDEFKGSELQVEIPGVDGLENLELEEHLNSEFLAYGEAISKAYKEDVEKMEGQMEENGLSDENINYDVTSGYKVVANDDKILTLSVYTVYTQGSSAEITTYYTVDKQKGEVVALSDLFRQDSGYLGVLNEEVRDQMKEQMESDETAMYFLDLDDDAQASPVTGSSSFYIDGDGELIIVFNQYEVAPGSMGNPEFKISHDVMEGILSITGLELLK